MTDAPGFGGWSSPQPSGDKACFEINLTPKYPGDSWVIVYLSRDNEIGDIRVQFYDDHFKVATFLPGRDVCVEGDTPKTEPEKYHWTEDRRDANKVFVQYVIAAYREGWSPWKR